MNASFLIRAEEGAMPIQQARACIRKAVGEVEHAKVLTRAMLHTLMTPEPGADHDHLLVCPISLRRSLDELLIMVDQKLSELDHMWLFTFCW